MDDQEMTMEEALAQAILEGKDISLIISALDECIDKFDDFA